MSSMSRSPDDAPTKVPTPKSNRLWGVLRYVLLAQGKPGELVIISHSNLFYWWPVWLCGFIMALVTYFLDQHLIIVPHHSVAASNRKVEVSEDGRMDVRDVVILPDGKKHFTRRAPDGSEKIDQPTIYIAHSRTIGFIFMVVLLLVITITNVPLRGLWSVVVIVIIVLGSVIFSLAGWWEVIFNRARLLAIHMNMGGYLFLSLTLLIIWVINFFFFDRQIYMIVTPGQVRVRTEIGGGETAYDTTGMVFQKQRSDMFRHWILGFGSGDLILRPAGGKEHIEMHNVLRVGRRVKEIETRLQERQVVTTG
jgi:hypothetical protein